MALFNNDRQVLPPELQTAQNRLYAIQQPHVPYKRDTVGDSEVALEGESIGSALFATILIAVLPWWAEYFMDDGGPDNDEWKDYAISTGATAVGVTWYLAANTDLGWYSFTWGMCSTALALFLMIVFHLITHKCVTMYVYNRIFRPSWVKKMRETDEMRYQDELATYPARLAKYEAELEVAMDEANRVLAVHNASVISDPSKRTFILEGGHFKKERNDDFVNDLSNGAKALVKDFNNFTQGKIPQDFVKNSTVGAKTLMKGIFK